MDPDTLDSISIGAVLKRETVMEKVKLLCAFVEEELSWIVQFFHDILNKEVTASSGKIGRIFGAIAAATGDLTSSPVHQFDHGCFLNHSASWFVLLSFSVYFQVPSQQPHKGIQGLRLTSTLFSNNLDNPPFKLSTFRPFEKTIIRKIQFLDTPNGHNLATKKRQTNLPTPRALPLFSPRAPWFPPRPKVKLFRSLSYLATSNIQFAQRAGRHTKKRASSPGRYPGGKQKRCGKCMAFLCVPRKMIYIHHGFSIDVSSPKC